MKNLFEAISENQLIPLQLKIALLILEEYNCRAQEILNAETKNFFPGKFLLLKGCKGSSDIVIRDRIILAEISKIIDKKSHLIFSSLSYYKLYKVCKEQYSHLFLQWKTKKNFKVTHGFRYQNASYTNDSSMIKSILNHNSLRSGKFYNKNISK